MSVFFIATVTIKDQKKFGEYAAQAKSTFEPYGGRMLTRGHIAKVLHGAAPKHQMVGIFSFPTLENMENWYQSPEYQALIPLRSEGADIDFIAYQEPQE